MTHATVQCTNVDENPILTRIHAHSLWIGPTTGEETFANTKGVFRHVDPNFNKWGTDKPSKATKDTIVAAYTTQKGTMFADLLADTDDLSGFVLTQGQSVELCRAHGDKLGPVGEAILFLFEVEGEYFVSDVRTYECGVEDTIQAYIDRPGNPHNWGINSRLWLAVPQL